MDANGVIQAVLLEQRLYTYWIGRRRLALTIRPLAAQRAARKALHRLAQAESEILNAYLDLRLVANPAPLQAADAVLDRFLQLLECSPGTRHDELLEVATGVMEAQRQFTDVCRDDLWYLPKRWQVYRLDWWRGRRWRRHRAD
ncbi:hypothetical protein ABS735_02870 [Streptomyces sp. MMCC 100]|uniref:hypothetical protein n=1 Tax=Streptomyces sp. MMCC 100 TaxID=3163555 RepID=UPI0035952C67